MVYSFRAWNKISYADTKKKRENYVKNAGNYINGVINENLLKYYEYFWYEKV